MSDLTHLEKRKFEKLLGMGSGYVLDFSNRSFKEFIVDSTGHNVYEDERYTSEGSSKANRLRVFWKLEGNGIVGKLMGDMLHCCSEDGSTALKEECRQIVARLLRGTSVPNAQPEALSREEAIRHKRSEELRTLKDDFFQLAADSDRNRAGLALEKLLNRLFELFELQPRQPFRVTGEQIDGSFQLDSQIYLLESKWEKHALPEADLLIFRGKIEGKSTFTRGVFIALNDVSAPAREAITKGKAPSFFVMNGHDLMMILTEGMSLVEFLRKRVRLLAEEGRMCVPFLEL